MLTFHARSDVGHRRQNNEDALLATEENGVFVVADGVGGRKAGELASAITINTFQSFAPRLQNAAEAYANSPNQTTRNAVLKLLDHVTSILVIKLGQILPSCSSWHPVL